MSNTARLNESEKLTLAKHAYEICGKETIDWISALDAAQTKLFPIEKRYAKGTLKCNSHVFVSLLKKENIEFNPIIHNGKVCEAQLNSAQIRLQPNPMFSTNLNQMKSGSHSPLWSMPQFVSPPPMIPVNTDMANMNRFGYGPKSSPGLNNFTFGNKIVELASCLAKQFETQLTAELDTALNKALGNVERSFSKKLEDARKIAGQVKQQLPKVMVIGVMGDVAFQTESEYGEMLDLRFYKQEENMNLIRSQAKHCDYVVLIVGHINHGHQDCVRNHPGLIFCNGGVTQMKEILLTLACK